MESAFQPRSLQLFQIAYLPLELSQKGFARGPDLSATISLLMQRRAITIPAWFGSASQDHYVRAVLLSAAAAQLQIGIKINRATELRDWIAPKTHIGVISALITPISSLKER